MYSLVGMTTFISMELSEKTCCRERDPLGCGYARQSKEVLCSSLGIEYFNNFSFSFSNRSRAVIGAALVEISFSLSHISVVSRFCVILKN